MKSKDGIEFFFFFFIDPATPQIYTLSLHDALPISYRIGIIHTPWLDWEEALWDYRMQGQMALERGFMTDRKSTRLNSSHRTISYAVFCLKKKTLNEKSHAFAV